MGLCLSGGGIEWGHNVGSVPRPQAKGWERVNGPRAGASLDPTPSRGPSVAVSPFQPPTEPAFITAFSAHTQAPPVQFRNFLIPGRCWSLHRARGTAKPHPSSGWSEAIRPYLPPHPNSQHIWSLSIPSQFYAPGGSACLFSAAAARLLGPRRTAEAAQAGLIQSPAPVPPRAALPGHLRKPASDSRVTGLRAKSTGPGGCRPEPKTGLDQAALTKRAHLGGRCVRRQEMLLEIVEVVGVHCVQTPGSTAHRRPHPSVNS